MAYSLSNERTYAEVNDADYTLDHTRYVPIYERQYGYPTPKTTLGAMEKLPAEVLEMVLFQLDIISLGRLRLVNRQAARTVDSIRHYEKIKTSAQVVLWGISQIETGRYISYQDLCEQLFTAKCESCEDFGGYLYLITCRRVCFLCFTQKEDYLPLQPGDAIRKYGLDKQDLWSIPQMRTFAGYYSLGRYQYSNVTTLIDHRAARQAGIAQHGSKSKMEDFCKAQLETRQHRHDVRARHSILVRQPRSQDPEDKESSNPKRFASIVRAPLLKRDAASPEWGFHCSACRWNRFGDRELHRRRKYTEESFRVHINKCGEIVNGKHVRETQLIVNQG